MFVGHYGVSFAAKSTDRTIPVWVLFLAVQLLDVVWSLFVLLGVEKVRIVPGITASNPLDLYYHAVHAQSRRRPAVVTRRVRGIPADPRMVSVAARRPAGRARRALALGARPRRAPSRSGAVRRYAEGGARPLELPRRRVPTRCRGFVRRDVPVPALWRGVHGPRTLRDAGVRRGDADRAGRRVLRPVPAERRGRRDRGTGALHGLCRRRPVAGEQRV